MYIHIQYWEDQPPWRRLFLPDQVAHFHKMGQVVADLHQMGIHLVNCPLEERNLLFLRERYLLVWRMSTPGLLDKLQETIAQSGWPYYFREIALVNEMIVPPTVINTSLVLLS